MTVRAFFKGLILAGLLIAPHVLLAQTRDEFAQKYGPKDAKGRYAVRPDIGFEVKYKYRVLSEMTIEPLADNDDGSRNVMSSQRADDALKELVPEETRGRKTGEGLAEFGCTSVNYLEYQLVRVSITKRCAEQGEGTYSIKVHWK